MMWHHISRSLRHRRSIFFRSFVPFLMQSGVRLLTCLCLVTLFPDTETGAQEPSSDTACTPTTTLRRSDDSAFRLAVVQGGEWLVCRSNTPEAVYEIDINPDEDVRFRWAAPRSANREVLYVSTVAKSHHPLSLQRNSAAGVLGMFIPFVDGVWESRGFGAEQKQDFVAYHVQNDDESNSPEPGDELGQWLDRWHNTGLWFVNRNTDEVVRSALVNLNDDERVLQRGAERLIRIQANRDRLSWIDFYSQEPNPRGAVLTVTVSYSGRSGRVYQYYFKEK